MWAISSTAAPQLNVERDALRSTAEDRRMYGGLGGFPAEVVLRVNSTSKETVRRAATDIGYRSTGDTWAYAASRPRGEPKDGGRDGGYQIGLDIELAGPLEEPQRRRLLEIAERCPVHRTLESEVMMETSLVGIDDRALATNRNAKVF